jgi:hypothetical protein
MAGCTDNPLYDVMTDFILKPSDYTSNTPPTNGSDPQPWSTRIRDLEAAIASKWPVPDPKFQSLAGYILAFEKNEEPSLCLAGEDKDLTACALIYDAPKRSLCVSLAYMDDGVKRRHPVYRGEIASLLATIPKIEPWLKEELARWDSAIAALPRRSPERR